MALDYGCNPAERGSLDRGLFFCGSHLSYGYEREGRCHAVSGWQHATRLYDGPISSPAVLQVLRSLKGGK